MTKLVLLTDYRGINVTDVTDLRKTLRGTNSEYKVIKTILQDVQYKNVDTKD